MEQVTVLSSAFIIAEQRHVSPIKVFIPDNHPIQDTIIKGRQILRTMAVNEDMVCWWAAPILDDGIETFAEKVFKKETLFKYDYEIYYVFEDGSKTNKLNKENWNISYKEFLSINETLEESNIREADSILMSEKDDRAFFLYFNEYGFEELIICIMDESIISDYQVDEKYLDDRLFEIEDEQDSNMAEILYATLIKNIEGVNS